MTRGRGTKDRQVALRLTQETIDRAEKLAPVMQSRPEWEPFRMTASAVMRVPLLKGLDLLETEVRNRER